MLLGCMFRIRDHKSSMQTLGMWMGTLCCIDHHPVPIEGHFQRMSHHESSKGKTGRD